MSRKVLVLNQDYSALSVCSVYKAIVLLIRQKAEIVSDVERETFNTISHKFPYPSIIRLNRYVNLPYRSGVVLNRQNIFKRDNSQCQYCGSTRDLTLDHVMPRSRGGKSTWDNLITACKSCNSRKGDLTPAEAGMPIKQQPYKPSFVMFMRDFSGYVADDWKIYLGQKVSA
jgi:5-methylcytosine-specific restriction endonuclease McrA